MRAQCQRCTSVVLPGLRGLRPAQQLQRAAAPRQRRSQLPRLARASLTGSSEETEQQQREQQPQSPEASIKQTLSNLDAMLGIEEKPEEEEVATVKPVDTSKITISADVLKQLAEAEAARAEQMGSAVNAGEMQSRIADSIERIVEQAKKIAEEEGTGGNRTLGEAAVQKELNNLVSVLQASTKGVDPEDLKNIKEQVFGATTFWVTETRPLAMQTLELGVVIKGNLRGKREAVFQEVVDKMATLFGDKYVVRLVEDPEATMEDMQMGGGGSGSDGAAPEPRVLFEILPMAAAQPPSTVGWQRAAAAVLLVLTLGSTLQFGLAANIGLLPKETLQWLANPANLNSELLPPGLETYDPLPFISSTGNIFLVTLLPQLMHELAHAAVAGARNIKIAPSFLIPNSQLGTFGSVTQLKSMARSRTDLFDFSASALAAGGVTSMALFLAGLVASHGGSVAEPGLLPVPSQLFQGSLLLGGMAKLGLSGDALSHAQVYVSPLMVGGWCGLVTTALNCLPVGNLDGGRAMMAAFGRNALAVSSLLCYVGLGLGLLGSSLALPFGLYVLICQRTAEQYIQDEVSGVSERRRAIAGVLIAFAVLTLLPMAPEVADVVAVGSPSNFI